MYVWVRLFNNLFSCFKVYITSTKKDYNEHLLEGTLNNSQIILKCIENSKLCIYYYIENSQYFWYGKFQ